MVTSAPGGMGLIVLEDWLDKRIVEPHEIRTKSMNKRRFYRMLFSPGRTVANLLRAEKPWYRDYRPIQRPE
jgi:arsenate reductase-like glutaredoxin family protein